MGLLFPDKGHIDAFGYNPGKRQPAYLQEVFMVAEEFYLPGVSINMFVRCNAPFYPKFNATEFWHYLSEFDVPRDNRLDQMSYGQKKKVLISFALACNTRLLLMDEPTNGLDIISKSQFRKVLAGVATEEKCIVISTHQVRDLESLIDFVTILDDGKVRFHHSIEDIQQALDFGISFERALPGHTLYTEQSLSGIAYIKKTDAQSSGTGKIDLEMLYKAVSQHEEAFRAAFGAVV